MKDTSAKSILELIRSAKVSELFIVSFVVLPIILSVWAFVLGQFGLFDIFEGKILIAGLMAVYLLSIAYMKFSESQDEKIRRDADAVIKELDSKKAYKRQRFETIRKKFGHIFSDDYLIEMIRAFPEELEESDVMDTKEKIKKPCIGLVVN